MNLNRDILLGIATRIFNNPDLMDSQDIIEVGSPANLADLIANDPLQAITDLLDIIESN